MAAHHLLTGQAISLELEERQQVGIDRVRFRAASLRKPPVLGAITYQICLISQFVTSKTQRNNGLGVASVTNVIVSFMGI
jgi:hypothetical protein